MAAQNSQADSVAVTFELGSNGVFFAGDKFSCSLTLRAAPHHHDTAADHQEEETLPSVVRIGFAALQLHGYCTLDKTLVKDGAVLGLQSVQPGDVHEQALAAAFNSQNPKGDRTSLFFATPVVFAFNDLELERGTSRTFVFETVLPPQLPSSHRGKASRFGYRAIAVVGSRPVAAVGLAADELQIVRLAFRVFHNVHETGQVLPFDLLKPICSHPSNHVVYCEEDRQRQLKLQELYLLGTNSAFRSIQFSEFNSQRDHLLELSDLDSHLPEYVPQMTLTHVTDLLQLSRHTNKSVFKISTAQGLVAHLILPRLAVRLGEDVQEPFIVRTAEATHRSTVIVVAEHIEHSLHLRQTSVSLPVPVEHSPSFATSAVHVKWELLCEFIVAGNPGDDQPWVVKEAHPDHFLLSLPQQIKTERFTMNIPLTVYPTLPEVARPSMLSRSSPIFLMASSNSS